MKSVYGLSTEQYDAMLLAQEGACAICGKTDPKSGHKSHFCVDHNHDTGLLRGILCDSCNRGLGLLQDDIAILKKAINYLELYETNK